MMCTGFKLLCCLKASYRRADWALVSLSFFLPLTLLSSSSFSPTSLLGVLITSLFTSLSLLTHTLANLRSICNSTQTQAHSSSPSASPSPTSPTSSSKSDEERSMKMDYEGGGSGFGLLYYRGLLQGKGILFVDQQLTAGEETASWVRQYASDVSMFHRDFAQVMMKLSSTQVLTGQSGEVRTNCREVSSSLW